MTYVIKLKLTKRQRQKLNEKFAFWSGKLIVASGILVVAIFVFLIVRALILTISFWKVLKQTVSIIGYFAVGMLMLNGISQFLSLTWEELREDNDWKLALFNKFTICFYPVLLWYTIILMANNIRV